MIITNLAFRNFRNLSESNLQWNKSFNVIWGKNAQGKTNLLEAIYILGYLKSFRLARNQDIICYSEHQAWLKGSVINQEVKHRLEIKLKPNGRELLVNEKQIQSIKKFFGYLRPVLFTPEELSVIKGYPAGRRSLLDRAILHVDNSYLECYQNYDRILKHRNQLLKRQASDQELQPWSEALIQYGARIRHQRLRYIERIKPYLKKVYNNIVSNAEDVDCRYSIEKKSEAELVLEIDEELKRLQTKERQLGLTLVGPHRDDLDFQVNKKSLKNFGSQGQQRSVLLSFKAAQVIDQETLLGEPPILLLDDLASELDVERQTGFVDFLLKQRTQVFLTTASPNNLVEAVKDKAGYYKVDCGKIDDNFPK